MLEEDYNNIISQIKNKSFTWSDYFSLAKDINIILDTEDSFDKQLARNIVIYIIDNWISVPQELRKLYTDIITKCGFYPYLEKEQDFFYLDNYSLNFPFQKNILLVIIPQKNHNANSKQAFYIDFRRFTQILSMIFMLITYTMR